MVTATRLYNEAQGRGAHPGLKLLRGLYPNGVPQNPSFLLCNPFGVVCETQHTQGALRDPGLCCETPLVFVETRDDLEMICENSYKTIRAIVSLRHQILQQVRHVLMA